MFKITQMKTEGFINPFGIQEQSPQCSWQVVTATRDWVQQSYHIWVASSEEILEQGACDVWDSGVVISSSMYVGILAQNWSSDTTYFWRVKLVGNTKTTPVTSEIQHFHTALFAKEDWKGKWVGETEDFKYHVFRKEIDLPEDIAKASLFVCGLGHNEVHLNGNKVGDRVLEPGWTNYEKTCLYSAYDVTKELQKGNNGIGILLGDGMFNVPGGRYVYFKRSYGKTKFLLQLNIELQNGERHEIVSDETWEMTNSPVTFSCIYGGEDFDGRLWDPDFTNSRKESKLKWEKAVIVAAPSGRLRAQSIPPLRVMERYEPVKITELVGQGFLFDFGKNFSGWAATQFSAKPIHSGQSVKMISSEILDHAGLPNQKVTGEGYAWTYTLNENESQTYAPKFTYTGFRYLLIEGAVPKDYQKKYPQLPVIEHIEGQFIYPDALAYGEFHCSNELWNKINEIVLQAMKSNIKSIFTDCPHREKLGWLEETHLIGPGIMYNFDVENLYKKILMDMEDAQHSTGLVPDTAPEYVVFGYHEGFIDSPEWGSSCIISPWYLYKMYGKISILERFYPMMRRYLEYLSGKTHHKMLHHGLGDWLDIGPNTPYSQNTPVPVVATSIYYYDLIIMAQIAELLGKSHDQEKYEAEAIEVKREFDLQYYDDQTGRYANGSQAAQAMALVTGLARKDETKRILDHIAKDITGRGNMTTAGDIGHPFLMMALTLFGRSDLIAAMANVTDRPSYGYQVVSGATTLAEEWDGPDPKNPHGSQNHFMLGSIAEWFYAGLAGIQRIHKESAYDTVLISPSFVETCEKVSAWTMHPHGRILVTWEKRAEDILVHLEIPPNTKADIFWETNEETMMVGSGAYVFSVPRNPKKQVKELQS